MNYFRIVFFILLVFRASAQYPTLSLGPDDTLDCRTNCTTLHANYAHSMATASYAVTQIPYNPFPFNSGTDINLVADDLWSTPIAIPFTFCFFGHNYNEVVIGTNGIISFNLAYTGACPWNLTSGDTLPTVTFPLKSIFCPMQDMNNNNGGTIYVDTMGSAPSRIFIVSYYQDSYYTCTDTFLTSQV